MDPPGQTSGSGVWLSPAMDYTVDDDLFIRPSPPPSADSLTLEPWIVQGDWGEDIELERPTVLPLDDDAASGLALFTDGARRDLETARATDLFETPVAHFLVRAFLADGMDEVMAHMTAIEAAVGAGLPETQFRQGRPEHVNLAKDRRPRCRRPVHDTDQPHGFPFRVDRPDRPARGRQPASGQIDDRDGMSGGGLHNLPPASQDCAIFGGVCVGVAKNIAP